MIHRDLCKLGPPAPLSAAPHQPPHCLPRIPQARLPPTAGRPVWALRLRGPAAAAVRELPASSRCRHLQAGGWPLRRAWAPLAPQPVAPHCPAPCTCPGRPAWKHPSHGGASLSSGVLTGLWLPSLLEASLWSPLSWHFSVGPGHRGRGSAPPGLSGGWRKGLLHKRLPGLRPCGLKAWLVCSGCVPRSAPGVQLMPTIPHWGVGWQL